MAELDKLLIKMVQTGAERAVLQSDQPLYIEVQQEKKQGPLLPMAHLFQIIREITPVDQRHKLALQGQLQFHYHSPHGIFHVAVLRNASGLNVTLHPGHRAEQASDLDFDFCSEVDDDRLRQMAEQMQMAVTNAIARGDMAVRVPAQAADSVELDDALERPRNVYAPRNMAPVEQETSQSQRDYSVPVTQERNRRGNDSGLGSTSRLPAELNGFNGGAFFLALPWAIAHSVWWLVGVICGSVVLGMILPILSLPLALIIPFWAGIVGNDEAWKNREWDSIEEFKQVQKVWTWWGLGAFGFFSIVPLLVMASNS